MRYYCPYNELCHDGILGQKWGIQRYQNSDGTLTEFKKGRCYREVQLIDVLRNPLNGANIKTDRTTLIAGVNGLKAEQVQ